MPASPSDHLRHGAARHPDRTVVVDGGMRFSYAALDAVVTDAAEALRHEGAGPGERVGLLLGNSARFVVAYLAVLRAEAVVVPFDPAAVPDRSTLEDADLRLLLAEPRFADALAQEAGGLLTSTESLAFGDALPGAVAVLRGDPALPPCETATAALLYTSGTTGRPKGVMLSRANLNATAEAGVALVGLTEADRVGVLAPLFHLYALREVDQALRVGATLVILGSLAFPAPVLRGLAEEQVTVATGVPSGLALLADARYDTLLRAWAPFLRALTLGTAPTPPALLARLYDALPETRVILTYGLTECSRACCRDGRDDRPGTVGRPYPGVEMKALDPDRRSLPVGSHGRLALQSAMVMQGYWRRPDHTAETLLSDGTLLTPDHGWLDADGYVHLLGRVDDVVNSGGEKISPEEVEAVLRTHPAVADVAVVGVDDPAGRLGQVLKAYIVPCGDPPEASDLQAHCAARLAPHKVPRLVAFRSHFPKTALGKTEKRLLDEMPDAVLADTEA